MEETSKDEQGNSQAQRSAIPILSQRKSWCSVEGDKHPLPSKRFNYVYTVGVLSEFYSKQRST